MRRRALLLAVPAFAAGCGFQLRQPPTMPFRSLAMVGFSPRSPLAAALRRALVPDVRVIDTPASADVVLEGLADARETVVVATTAAGEVRELQLRVRLGFRLQTPKGRVLIEPTELLLSRDISYSESAALAKEREQAQVFLALQDDIVLQVMRRLAAVVV